MRVSSSILPSDHFCAVSSASPKCTRPNGMTGNGRRSGDSPPRSWTVTRAQNLARGSMSRRSGCTIRGSIGMPGGTCGSGIWHRPRRSATRTTRTGLALFNKETRQVHPWRRRSGIRRAKIGRSTIFHCYDTSLRLRFFFAGFFCAGPPPSIIPFSRFPMNTGIPKQRRKYRRGKNLTATIFSIIHCVSRVRAHLMSLSH